MSMVDSLFTLYRNSDTCGQNEIASHVNNYNMFTCEKTNLNNREFSRKKTAETLDGPDGRLHR